MIPRMSGGAVRALFAILPLGAASETRLLLTARGFLSAPARIFFADDLAVFWSGQDVSSRPRGVVAGLSTFGACEAWFGAAPSIVLGAPTATVVILHVRLELPFTVSPVTGFPATVKPRVITLAASEFGSALIPTLLGAGAGLLLAHPYPAAVGPKASAGEFAAAVGICAGVTALPVLGAILLQMGLLRQRLGQLALACAAINDALLWIFLAGLLAYGAGWRAGGSAFWPVLVGGPLYLLLVFGLVRPALARLARTARKRRARAASDSRPPARRRWARRRPLRRWACTMSWAHFSPA